MSNKITAEELLDYLEMVEGWADSGGWSGIPEDIPEAQAIRAHLAKYDTLRANEKAYELLRNLGMWAEAVEQYHPHWKGLVAYLKEAEQLTQTPAKGET